MALSLVQIDTLANDPAFRARIRACATYESAERAVGQTWVSNAIMQALVEDGPLIHEWCWRTAYLLKGQADPLNVADAAIKTNFSLVMDRIYPV